MAFENLVSDWKVAQGMCEYLQPPKENYISDFSLREPFEVRLLEANDSQTMIHNIYIILHTGGVNKGESPAPFFTMVSICQLSALIAKITPFLLVCLRGLDDTTTPMTLMNPGAISLSAVHTSP